jgi:hypothetical protein
MEELRNTYGTSGGIDYQSKIETIDNSYAFLKFGRFQALHQKYSYKCYYRESNKQEEEGLQRFKYQREY